MDPVFTYIFTFVKTLWHNLRMNKADPRRVPTQDVNTSTRVSGVAKPNMVMRSLRVPEKLWDAAKAKADEREENISDVLRDALERYVNDDET